jgi:hypothetical protein
MKRPLATLLCAGISIGLSGCSQSGATLPPVEKKTEIKVNVEEDGSKRTVKETTILVNPDGTKTETTKKTETKVEVHDGKILELPGIEIRKKP